MRPLIDYVRVEQGSDGKHLIQLVIMHANSQWLFANAYDANGHKLSDFLYEEEHEANVAADEFNQSANDYFSELEYELTR